MAVGKIQSLPENDFICQRRKLISKYNSRHFRECLRVLSAAPFLYRDFFLSGHIQICGESGKLSGILIKGAGNLQLLSGWALKLFIAKGAAFVN